MSQVMSEQTARLQELRRQLESTDNRSTPSEPPADTQTLRDELQLVLRREREAQDQLTILRSTVDSHRDQLQAQASDLEALTRTVNSKEEIIKVCERVFAGL